MHAFYCRNGITGVVWTIWCIRKKLSSVHRNISIIWIVLTLEQIWTTWSIGWIFFVCVKYTKSFIKKKNSHFWSCFSIILWHNWSQACLIIYSGQYCCLNAITYISATPLCAQTIMLCDVYVVRAKETALKLKN